MTEAISFWKPICKGIEEVVFSEFISTHCAAAYCVRDFTQHYIYFLCCINQLLAIFHRYNSGKYPVFPFMLTVWCYKKHLKCNMSFQKSRNSFLRNVDQKSELQTFASNSKELQISGKQSICQYIYWYIDRSKFRKFQGT